MRECIEIHFFEAVLRVDREWSKPVRGPAQLKGSTGAVSFVYSERDRAIVGAFLSGAVLFVAPHASRIGVAVWSNRRYEVCGSIVSGTAIMGGLELIAARNVVGSFLPVMSLPHHACLSHEPLSSELVSYLLIVRPAWEGSDSVSFFVCMRAGDAGDGNSSCWPSVEVI